MDETHLYVPSHLKEVYCPVVKKVNKQIPVNTMNSFYSPVIPGSNVRTPAVRHLVIDESENPFMKSMRLPDSRRLIDDSDNFMKSVRSPFVDVPVDKPRIRTSASRRFIIDEPESLELKNPLMKSMRFTDKKKTFVPEQFTVSGRWNINDGVISQVSKKQRHPVNERDLTAFVKPISSTKVVVFKPECSCDFCSLLRSYNGNPLYFSSEEIVSECGHGFYPNM